MEFFFFALVVAVVVGTVLSFLLSPTLFRPHARASSIVGGSDRRSAAIGWLFACDGGVIGTRTAGPDRKLGTDDDIRVPSQ